VVDDEQVVADGVVIVRVAAGEPGGCGPGGRQLVVEDFEAKALGSANLLGGRGKANFHGADAPEHRVEGPVISDRPVQSRQQPNRRPADLQQS
jgi:hypothetical protein